MALVDVVLVRVDVTVLVVVAMLVMLNTDWNLANFHPNFQVRPCSATGCSFIDDVSSMAARPRLDSSAGSVTSILVLPKEY